MNYRSLCTQYYDVERPFAAPSEVDFYEEELKKVSGPYLEAMCGSGQFLIPLADRGVRVDGFDLSPHMITSCHSRLPNAELFVGDVETISLPKQYGAIFVAVGSFQLVTNARAALENLRRHLLPGGVLLLEVWVPWEAIESGKAEAPPAQVSLPTGEVIRLECQCVVEREEQTLRNQMLFTRLQGGKRVEQEEEELILRWYYQHEMKLLLELAGFERVEQIIPRAPHVPHSTVYRVR